MRSYGACNQADRVRRVPSLYSTKAMLLLVALALIVTSAIITIVAYRRDHSNQVLLSAKQLPSDFTKLAESNVGSAEPTDADAEPFQKSAKALLAKIKLEDISKTDLESSCQSSLYPCIDRILSCVDSKLVPTSDGKITPGITVCNCFSRGFVEGVLVPDKPDIKFPCSYECIGSILQQAESYVSQINGPSGDSLSCTSVIDKLGSQTFGNSDGYIASDNDADALVMMPIDDPKVVRAAEALRLSINSQRRLECPARQEITQNGTIKYAKRGIVVDGYGQYKLEVAFGSEIVFARISHLPKNKQLTDPAAQTALDDPRNLDGRFVLLSSVPKPCENGIHEQLAVSASVVEAINKQNLPWKAALKQEYEGKQHKDFAHGLIPLPHEEMKRYHMQLDTTDFVPPEAYDERDVYEGQTPCAAFEVLDQGNCGSCYAFASASAFSARLCRAKRNSIGNVVVSPQQLMDCNNGCGGGAPIYVYETLTKTPTVESWCDPYKTVKDTCGSNVCGTGNQYLAQPNSPRYVGGVLSDGSMVLQMQLELLRNGPGVVGFSIMSDIGAYSSGVYVVSENATKLGGHAVMLIGWGVEAGIPYWILQNSYGKGWAEKGFFRIRRGTNECGIEEGGMIVAKPVTPTACPESTCAPGSVTLKDCTCRCDNPSMTGPTCSECTLQCSNGGVRDGGCTRCTCLPGFFGPQCEGGYSFSPLASCAGTPAPITITYSFGGSVPPPTQASYVGIFTLTQNNAFKHDGMSFVCGSKYDSAVNGGLCPSAGSFTIAPPAAVGEYRIAVIPWQPMNEFGQQGYLGVQARDVIALYTVLDNTACSSVELSLAQTNNNPAARLRGQLAADDKARAEQLAAMKARLDTAKPLISTLAAELPASLDITGLDPARPVVWIGLPYEVCYRLEPSANVNPKRLFLVVDDGKGTYYGTGLGSGDATLPTTYQGCVQFTIATWLTKNRYYIELRDQLRDNYLIRTKVFDMYSIYVRFEYVFDYPTYVSIKTGWRVDAEGASPWDVVKVINSKGTVVTWFYTSTLGQTTPSDTTTARVSGALNVKIYKLNSVPGGYKVKFYPRGGDAVAAVGKDWIVWSKYGL